MKQTVILDSTQISTLYECEEKWRLTNSERLIRIENIQPPDYLTMGTLGHKYLELYYTGIGLDLSAEEIWKSVICFDPDKADEADSHTFPLVGPSREKVKNRISEYAMHYAGRDFNPQVSRRPSISVDENDNLYDSFTYKPLVEQGFSYLLYEDKDYLFILEGRIDLISETNGQPFWVDHKFQIRERELYRKSVQFKNYSLATNMDLGVINYVRFHDKITPKTFVRQPISFSAMERRMWKEELIQFYVDFTKSDHTYRNRDSCGGKFGHPCEFTSICEEYNPIARATIKDQHYTGRKEWKPW